MMTMQEKIKDGLSYLTIGNPIKFILIVFVIFVAPVLTRQWLLDSQSLVTTIPLMMLWTLGVMMYLAVATAALTSTVFSLTSLISDDIETFESVGSSLFRIVFGTLSFLGLSKVLLFLLTAHW